MKKGLIYISKIFRKIENYIYIFIPILIIFYLILKYGNYQFPGIDGGALAHAAWSMYTGQIPYKDLVTPVPVGFLLGAKWAYDLFGVSWNSLLIILSIFSYLTYLLQHLILIRLGVNKTLSFIVALFIQIITNIVITMWWYNNITSVCIALFISSALLFYNNPKNSINAAIFVITTCLLLLMKISTAYLSIGLIYFLFAFFNKTRLRTFAIGILSIIAIVVFLYAVNINPMDMAKAYLKGADRMTLQGFYIRLFVYEPLQFARSFLLAIPFLFGFIMLIEHIFSGRVIKHVWNRYRIYILLAFIGLFICIFGLATNSEIRIIEFPAFFVSSLLFLLVLKKDKKVKNIIGSLSLSKIFVLMMISVFLLSIQSTVWTVFRRRVEATGDYYYGIYRKHNVEIVENKFFNGFYADQYFVELNRDLKLLRSTLEKTKKLEDNRIYFGPKVDFGYALFNVEIPKGLPLWWPESSIYHCCDNQTILAMDVFRKANFTVVITKGGELVFHPGELIDYLNNNYNKIQFGHLVLWINPQEEVLLEELMLSGKFATKQISAGAN